MHKSDFPIFTHHPDLIYLDSASTTQKPQVVIDAVNHYLVNNNANIHRGIYPIAEQSEELYHQSKKKYADFINASPTEIIYTYNATYGFNMIVQALSENQYLKKGDKILLGIREHHANIIPRQIAAKRIGFTIQFINMTDDFDIDIDDFLKKYDTTVKIVSLSAASNVTGTIFDLVKIKKMIKADTLFIVDGSQLLGKKVVDVKKWDCDIMIATAHKMFALTGLGMVYMRKSLIKELQPTRGGGGVIEDVDTHGFQLTYGSEKREPGTPNIIGAVSLSAAIDYINNIGLETIQHHDQQLIAHFLNTTPISITAPFPSKGGDRGDKNQGEGNMVLIGKPTPHNRLGIFSFTFTHEPNHIKIAEMLAKQNICIRAGGHCTHPLRHHLHIKGACRISTHIYNNESDIDKTMKILHSI